MSGPRVPSDAEIVEAIERAPDWLGASTAFLVGFLRMGRVENAMRVLGPKLASMRSRGILNSTRTNAPTPGDTSVMWELAR